MTDAVPWNNQPLEEWAQKYAAGSFIDLDGRRTHFIDKGSGSPILLVHGFFYDSFTWHNNIDALSTTFRELVPDLWGFGYSTREPLDYGYPLYAEQLLIVWGEHDKAIPLARGREMHALLQGTRQEERMDLYRRAEQILAEEAPILPATYGRLHLLLKPWVRRFHLSPMKQRFWHEVVIEREQSGWSGHHR